MFLIYFSWWQLPFFPCCESVDGRITAFQGITERLASRCWKLRTTGTKPRLQNKRTRMKGDESIVAHYCCRRVRPSVTCTGESDHHLASVLGSPGSMSLSFLLVLRDWLSYSLRVLRYLCCWLVKIDYLHIAAHIDLKFSMVISGKNDHFLIRIIFKMLTIIKVAVFVLSS